MRSSGFSLDTSVFVRLLVQEPVSQFHLAARLVEDQLTAGVTIHVSDLVLAETYFALQAFYQIPRQDALQAIAVFAETTGITLTPVARAVMALPGLARAKPGFVDRLIHGESQPAGHTCLTFEKAARKLPATVVLSAS